MGAEDSRQLVEKPELVAAKMQKEEEARNRALRKARESGLEAPADGRSYGRIGMSSDYLNAGTEDQYDSFNISDIKKGKRNASRQDVPRNSRQARQESMT